MYFFKTLKSCRPAMNYRKIDTVMACIRENRLSRNELNEIQHKISLMTKQKTFYTLVFNGVSSDPTDRFYEVCDEISDRLVYEINKRRIPFSEIPYDLFDISNGKLISIKTEYRDEQTLYNIMRNCLPRWFNYTIETFEITV